MKPKVSIVITAHNYAKYLPRALESALGQAYASFEVVVVNDGSTDGTDVLLESYSGRTNLKIVTLRGVGLAAASNQGIDAAEGEYIVRLDADDWFDENLIVVLANYLDKYPNVGMVFCDYHTVDVHGDLIQTIRRAKANDEVELLDRPCLAAGAMYRRRCYDVVGGYNESLRYQEDYDFWIKFIEKFEVRNVSLPLMYYRQHGSSMSRNWDGRMQARRRVKHKFVQEHRSLDGRRVLAVIPARADRFDGTKFPLLELGGQTLLERAVGKLAAVDSVERVIVSTEDPEIAEHALVIGAEVPLLRSRSTISSAVTFAAALGELTDWLKREEGYEPDIIAVHYPHSPFLQPEHFEEAIDSMLLYRTDSVLAVVEDLTYHWKIGANGLEPVGYQQRVVRQDKDLIFKEAGGMYLVRDADMPGGDDLLYGKIGHIELSPKEAFRIYGAWEYDLAQNIAQGENG